MLYRLACVPLALVVACGPGDSGDDDDDNGVADAGVATALAIEPENPTVVVVNGSAAAVNFSATVSFSDGSTAVVDSGSWTLDLPSLGSLSATTGKFVASGDRAGAGTVTINAHGLSAQTTVTVRVEDEHFGDGVPPDAPDRFSGTPITGDPESPVLVYPLDTAIVPSPLKPIDIQWEGGVDGDLYRITVDAGLAKATAYVLHDGAPFKYDWVVDGGSWSAIKASTGSDPVNFTVDRWSSGNSMVYGSATHVINVVEANVTGAIYYWDLSDGRIQRITAQGRDTPMPSPPPRPSDGARCVACHTVSRDGSRMAAELWGGNEFGAIFDLTIDLTADPAPTVVAPDQYRALFSTFNPDASRLLINYNNALSLVDATTGAPVPAMGSGLPAAGAAHPTWSPDDSLIAYVANHDGSWAVDFTLGDLAVVPVTGPDTFGDPVVLRTAEGMANAWPSFSPDSQWIAFGRGAHSRGRNDSVPVVYPGSLWMIARGGGTPIELANANGGAGVMDSYLPNFSPFDEGGYFWLAFYSTRDYGNVQAGSKGTGRRQIWVTAIKNAPSPGEDPSAAGYWLIDQDVGTDNMSGYWTVEPPVD